MTSEDGSSAPRARTIGRRDAVRVAAVSLISGGSSYVVLTLASRTLPVAQNTVFVTFWSALFAVFGVLSGLSVEVTRAVTAQTLAAESDRHDRTEGQRHPRVITVGAGAALVVGVVVGAAAPWWGARVFPTGSGVLPWLVVAGGVAYALHSTVVGSLAGRRWWGPYTSLIGADALVRLALVVAAALLLRTVTGLASAAVAAALTWAAFVAWSRQARQAAMTRADVPVARFASRVTATSVAAGASAVLVVGFPTLLAATTSAASFTHAAPLLLAVSFTRAPLMIPLNAYQGVAVSHFVAHRDQGLRALRPVGQVVAAATGLIALAAYLVGSPVLAFLLGPDYRVSGAVLAGLSAAAGLLAMLTLTGALCQAMTWHRVYVAGWICALAAALLVLMLPAPLELRAVLALAGGPVVGLVVHLVPLGRRRVHETRTVAAR
ncbi:MAG: hypothetical protein B7X41_02755 [Microbacterium sp. 14-71-5]|nr:MAG: hypothetical protein B7X41_02755 [Microbacterium sp. 14-71-5]